MEFGWNVVSGDSMAEEVLVTEWLNWRGRVSESLNGIGREEFELKWRSLLEGRIRRIEEIDRAFSSL